MKALIHFLSGALLYIGIILSGAWLVQATLYEDVWDLSVGWVADHRLWTLSALAAGWWMVILFALTARQRGRREGVVSMTTETGTVSVSTRALEDYLMRLRNEFAALLDLKTGVSARGADLKVELHVKIRAGTQIPELCRMLQDRVRQQIHGELGLAEPRDVCVNVKEIVVSAAETQSGASSADSGAWAGGARM